MRRIRVFFLILVMAFLFFRPNVSYAQEKGFLSTFSEENHSWLVTDALEASDGSFVICAYDNWGDDSMLLRLSPDGEILAKTIITAEDTTIYVRRCLLVSDEGCQGVVAICPCHPNDGSTPTLLYIRADEDLNILFKKTIPCCFFDSGSGFYETKFIRQDSLIYGTLTSSLSGAPNAIFLTQFDIDGNLLNCKRCERDSLNSVCNLFHAGEGRIGLFGNLDSSYMGFLTFDTSLQLIRRDTIFQWSQPEGNQADYCHYYIHDVINSHAAMLPDGSHVVSARLFETLHHVNGYPNNNVNDRSVILAKYENDFRWPETMLVTEHLNDSVEYPAFFRSVDVRETAEEECEVFQCSILNEHPQYGLLQPFPTGIVVAKTDQDLHVVWKRRFLGLRNYQAMTINATCDGGCLVTGSVGDYQTQRFDIFALKINADGAVGIGEIQEEFMAAAYPNPGKDVLNISTALQNAHVEVYDTNGRLVHRQGITENATSIDAANWPAGVYVWRVMANGKEAVSGKWVKE